MSLDLVYVINDTEFWLPLGEHDLLERIAQSYPVQCKVVFGVEDSNRSSFGDPYAVVPRDELLAALDSLLIAFKNDPELCPRRYVFDFEVFPGVRATGDTQVNGIKLPGQEGRYHLLGGIDQCVLREFHFGSQHPSYGDPIDVRDKTAIESENYGQIRIRSTKRKPLLARELQRLRQFVQSQPGDTITKRLC